MLLIVLLFLYVLEMICGYLVHLLREEGKAEQPLVTQVPFLEFHLRCSLLKEDPRQNHVGSASCAATC